MTQSPQLPNPQSPVKKINYRVAPRTGTYGYRFQLYGLTMMRAILCLLTLFCLRDAVAQIEKENSEDKGAIPYRPRISEFTFNQVYDYTTRSASGTYGDAGSKIEQDDLLKIRLGIPFVAKGQTLFGMQLKYDQHAFMFDSPGSEPYALYSHMQSKNFTALGARFLLQQPFGEEGEITVVAGAEVKSDRLELNRNTAKYYTHLGYAEQISHNTKIGGGLYLAYTLGSFQLYPLFCYEHHINPKWTVDLQLPKRAVLRFKASERFYISAVTEVKGWRYAIHNAELSDDVMVLRKTDINFGLSFEHELYDWLWLGLDTGLSKNLRYFLARPGDNRAQAAINLVSKDAPYLNFGLFIVPPKRFYD